MIPSLRIPSVALLMAAASWASAEVVDSTIELKGVSRVHLFGPYELTITQGDKEFVTVTTDKRNLDNIEALVTGDELRVGSKERQSWGWFDADKHEAKFTVQVRSLEAVKNRGSGRVEIGPIEDGGDLHIDVQGSGDTRLEFFNGDTLKVESTGSGDTRIRGAKVKDLRLQSRGSGDVAVGELTATTVDVKVHGSSDVRLGDGEAEELELSLHGSGDIDASDFKARRAEVSVFGSGDIKVYASETLDVSVHGSGDVRYGGNPKVSRSVQGSGDIEAE